MSEKYHFPVDPWLIRETSFSLDTNYCNESIFALSNGFIGTRGTHPECWDFSIDQGLEGVFLNGFYESQPVRYGEWNYGFPTESQTMLNLPNPKPLRLFIEDEVFDLREGTIRAYERILHLREAIVTRDLTWLSPKGNLIRIQSSQLVSLTHPDLMLLKYSFTPLNFSGKVTLRSSIFTEVENHTRKTNPLVDYGPFGQCLAGKAAEADSNALFYQAHTKNTDLTMACACSHTLSETPVWKQYETSNSEISIRYSFNAKENVSISLTKYMVLTDSQHIPESRQKCLVLKELRQLQQKPFEFYLSEQTNEMNYFWQGTDVQIDGNDAMLQGLRFNLFHVMQACGRDEKNGTPAKGLTGEGYEGHTFWDTEMYMFPLMLMSDPKVARAMLDHRYCMLPQARERARVLGHSDGALFPWRTINGNEASTYFPLGTAQYHINADVAWAFWQYYLVSGDVDYLFEKGAEVLIETARVWADVGSFSDYRDGKYCICAVTGPDEYNAIVDNNFYTNIMARENLRYALRAIEILRKADQPKLDALLSHLEVSDDETALWQRAADEMYLPYYEKEQVFLQDDGFLMRKPWDDSRIPPDKRHLLYENYHPLFIYRQQMCKQADLIFALQLLSEQFDKETLKRNYDFYQARTLHHSSLSKCIFGILACRIGNIDEALKAFEEAARMDLDDTHHDEYAGIHGANMGGSWQLIVYGLAGFRITDGMPDFSPQAVLQWKSYAFSLRFRGCLLRVKVDSEGIDYYLEEGNNMQLLSHKKCCELKNAGDHIHESL